LAAGVLAFAFASPALAAPTLTADLNFYSASHHPIDDGTNEVYRELTDVGDGNETLRTSPQSCSLGCVESWPVRGNGNPKYKFEAWANAYSNKGPVLEAFANGRFTNAPRGVSLNPHYSIAHAVFEDLPTLVVPSLPAGTEVFLTMIFTIDGRTCSTIGCSGGTGIGHETHIAPAITGTIMTTIDGYDWTTASSGGGSGPNAVDLNAGPGTHIGADRMSVRVGDEFGVRVELYAQSYWSSSDAVGISEEYPYWVGTAGEADFASTVTLSEVELEDASGDLIARFEIEWSDGEVTLPEPRAAIPWAIFTLLALRARRCRC